MGLRKTGLWLIGVPAFVVGLAVGYYYVILDWHGRPFCHKQITAAFQVWMVDNKETATFPNVRGTSQYSLNSIRDQMNGYMEWATNYQYVPGLKDDDPGKLILMYYNRPTRWSWHGVPPTIFKGKAWIVVPVGYNNSSMSGEQSERISTEEFKRRLKETTEFVRTNERPNWQTVVAEHTKFLESLESSK